MRCLPPLPNALKRVLGFRIINLLQAFLTGTLQNFARRMKFAIDTVQFNFVVVETPWEELNERPQVM